VLTPRFSPSTQEITTWNSGRATRASTCFNIETGQREISAISPACRSRRVSRRTASGVIMSLQQGGNSNLFVDGSALEVEPRV